MTTIELPAATPARAFAPPRIRFLCLLFFFSGFPALIYQLVWQRSLFRIFGVNSESVTVVVTAFMLGLGLGSLCGGWISRRSNVQPLLLLGVIELATAAFGLVSLQIFEQVGALVADLPLSALAVINLALVLLPTLLMGATLPILVAYLARMSGQIGGAVGTLYFVNTLGAGTACLVCAILIFPHLGMHAANMIAAGINIAVGLGAIAAHVLLGPAPGGFTDIGHGAARTNTRHGFRRAARNGGRIHLAVLRDLSVPRDVVRLRIELAGLRYHAVRLSHRHRGRRPACRPVL
jgi:MFS family permease